MFYTFPNQSTGVRCPKTRIKDNGVEQNIHGVTITLEGTSRLWVYWIDGNTVVEPIFPDSDMSVHHALLPYVDLKKGTMNGVKAPATLIEYLKQIHSSFISSHNLLLNLVIESKKVTEGSVYFPETQYIEPNPVNTYILIDDRHVYLSDPSNTSEQLRDEQRIYECNDQSFEVIDSNHKRFIELRVPSNIRKITLT